MKFLALLILLLISFSSFGQFPGDFIKPNSSRGIRYNGLMADRELYIPLQDTDYIPMQPGAIVCRPSDNLLWTYNGLRWVTLASSFTTVIGDTNFIYFSADDFYGSGTTPEDPIRINPENWYNISRVDSAIAANVYHPDSPNAGSADTAVQDLTYGPDSSTLKVIKKDGFYYIRFGNGGYTRIQVDSAIAANKYHLPYNGNVGYYLGGDSALHILPAGGGNYHLPYNGNAGYFLGGDSALHVLPSAAIWGNITGTLSAQTDLQAALDAKFNIIGGTLTGTGGSGFVGFAPQSSNPSTPASGFRLFATNPGAFAWITSQGYSRELRVRAQTQNNIYYLQDKSYTIADSADVAIRWALAGNAASSSTSFLGTTNNTSLRLITNNSQKMVVDSNGNVGIGKTAPAYKLDISTSVAPSDGVSVTNTSATGTAGLATVNNINTQGGLQTFGSTYSTGGLADKSAFGATKDIVLYTDALVTSGGTHSVSIRTGGLNASQERMRIDSAGNVGIGTISPQKKLHTVGTVRHATLGTATTDTTTYKPVGINSSGDILPLTSWTLSGGGGISATDSSNVTFYGAVGDGTTDNTTAVQLAFDSHKNIYFPSGTYIVSNLTLNSQQMISGYGTSSIIKFKTGSTGFMMEGSTNVVHLKNISLDGGTNSDFAAVTTVGTRSGVHVNQLTEGTSFDHVYIHGFSNMGMAWTGNTTPTYSSPVVTGSDFYYNFIGLNTANTDTLGGEYTKISANTFHHNRYGIKIYSGNTIFNSNTVIYNGYGVSLLDGGNAGHGNIVGNEINHNTVYGLYIKKVAYGEAITANQFFYNDIYIDSSSNLNITGGAMGNLTLTLRYGNTNYLKGVWTRTLTLSRTSDNFIISDLYGETPGTYTSNYKDLIADANLNYTSSKLIVGGTTPDSTLHVIGGLKFDLPSKGAGKVLTDVSGTGAATWATPSASGVTTMAAIGATPNANAASISGSTLTMQPASTSFGGVVTTGTQSIAGAKTFTSSLGVTTAANANGGLTVTNSNAGNAATSSLVLVNDNANQAGMYIYGSGTSTPNRTYFVATKDFVVGTDAGVASGGTSKFQVYTGGYNNATTPNFTFDASGRLGVGSTFNSPTSSLQTTSFSPGYVAKTANYTATISDFTINCTANSFTVTLPTSVGITGRVYVVKNSGAGTITMAGTSSQTFDTVTSPTIAAGAVAQYQSDGANWIKIN